MDPVPLLRFSGAVIAFWLCKMPLFLGIVCWSLQGGQVLTSAPSNGLCPYRERGKGNVAQGQQWFFSSCLWSSVVLVLEVFCRFEIFKLLKRWATDYVECELKEPRRRLVSVWS